MQIANSSGLNEPTYLSGENVEGVVILVVQQHHFKVNSLQVKWEGIFETHEVLKTTFLGVEHSSWGNGQYSADRTIFSKVQTLWSKDENGSGNADANINDNLHR
jgi:hypothetical protein